MKLSQFGKQLSTDSGIVNLMEDLGDAINVNPNLLFMGGGNPARVPAFENIIAAKLRTIANQPELLHKLIGTYQSPRGSEELIAELVKFFREVCGWPVSEKNIALANGSQSAFFILLNMFADETAGKICFPLMPEYLGYSDQGTIANLAVACKPKITLLDDKVFKYQLDIDAVEAVDNVAAYCVSRPTNPSGNMLAEDEVLALCELAKKRNTHLLLDCAYGNPFPGVVYDAVESFWHEKLITVLSLSKLGLPGTRTGIVVGPEDVIDKFCQINTIVSLANGNLGPVLLTELLKSGELPNICEHIICAHYKAQRDFALQQVQEKFAHLPYKIHQAEGAFFIWLWFENLPISTQALYEKLKARAVLIMPGEHFFFGLENKDEWGHSRECIRLTYCQGQDVVEQALAIIAEVLEEVFTLGNNA